MSDELFSLRQYFDDDFKQDLHLTKIFNLPALGITVEGRLYTNFKANSKYSTFFVPFHKMVFQVVELILSDIVDTVLAADSGLVIKGGYLGEKARSSSRTMPFSGHVYVYSERDIADSEFEKLAISAERKGLSLTVRGPEYASSRNNLTQPLAFMAHDSRDKESIARPLVSGLRKMLVSIWYDEFSLRVGDSLREKIEKGLKECKKCILVLTPNFLSNKGWTKKEFNAVFTREIVEEKDVILPVWAGVTREEVFDYSPILADKYAVRMDEGIEEVIRKLYLALKN